MPADRTGARIEALIRRCEWKQAQAFIEKRLAKDEDDHWLWARLSGVKYEQRDYEGALTAAEAALAIVPDCPLALWSKAGALEMLAKANEAAALYAHLFRRGLQELKHPDADAGECWEGPEWTAGLMADCLFRTAGCRAKAGRRDEALQMYQELLGLLELGVTGIYSREDVVARLNKLVPSKKAKRQAAIRWLEKDSIAG